VPLGHALPYRQWQVGVAIYISSKDMIPSILQQSLHKQLDVIANHPNKDYHPGMYLYLCAMFFLIALQPTLMM
jgi:hypothetical protein